MPEFPKPDFPYGFDVDQQVGVLRRHRTARGVPRRPKSRLSVATWNIANLGAHDRRDPDHALMAEMISSFDLVALQEVREDIGGLYAIRSRLSSRWRMLFTDRAGNDERLTFLYRSDRLRRELVGEVNLLPHERRRVTLPGVSEVFTDFNRSPFLCSFESGSFLFSVANVHIYFGEDSGAKFDRRRLEMLAIATYARLHQAKTTRYDAHLMLIGDFNTPKAQAGDKVYQALLDAGLVPR